ncbi:ATP-binding protein [Streptomyces sp. NPDC001787]|uniref:ATP-binding protein n=1 Tax=Streptomyces sp. NPDC001787 TaxID=3154523 RepID=UPI0033251583
MTLTAPPEGSFAQAIDPSRASSAPSGFSVRDAAAIAFGRSAPIKNGLSGAEQPRRAREFASAVLARWGLSEYTDDVKVLVSELTTNGLLHGNGTDEIGVTLTLTDDGIGLVVTGSPYTPVPPPPVDDLSERGRGLQIVAELSDAWGVSENGAHTWCLLDRHPAAVGPVESSPVVRELRSRVRAPTIGGIAQAVQTARIHTGLCLTLLGWAGPVSPVDDLVRLLIESFGSDDGRDGPWEFSLGFGLTEAHELVIEIEDSVPEFRRFDPADAGHGDLRAACSLGADITWQLRNGRKTGRACLPAPREAS